MRQEIPAVCRRLELCLNFGGTMQKARRSWRCCSGPRAFPASPSVVHPLLIPENTETIEQMEEEHCPCIWLNALKGHF